MQDMELSEDLLAQTLDGLSHLSVMDTANISPNFTLGM